MHPFGGTPVCPRCSKAVYAAEQVMGPGRKLYHKPCLACTNCNKRLDSLSLLEHDQMPYCKPCHTRNFGTRDLRQANLPHRGDTVSASPVKSNETGGGIFPSTRPEAPVLLPTRSRSPVRSPVRARAGTMGSTYASQRNGSASPTPERSKSVAAHRDADGEGLNGTPPPSDDQDRDEEGKATAESPSEQEEKREGGDAEGTTPDAEPAPTGVTNTGRSARGFPRTVPLSPSHTPSYSMTLGRSNTDAGVGKRNVDVPQIAPIWTGPSGTRYGAALSGAGSPPSPKKWGGSTPICPRCKKNVYFAEQVKAVGKAWHKGCLRCTECSTSLDSSRLTEKDGDPFCHRCYSKLHGPQGSGYALLGKAGG